MKNQKKDNQAHMNQYMPYEVAIEVGRNDVKVKVIAKNRLVPEKFKEALAEVLKITYELRDDILRFKRGVAEVLSEGTKGGIVRKETIEKKKVFIGSFPKIKLVVKGLKLNKGEILALILYEYDHKRSKELAEAMSHITGKQVTTKEVSAYLTGKRRILSSYVIKDENKKWTLTEEGGKWVEEELLPKVQ